MGSQWEPRNICHGQEILFNPLGLAICLAENTHVWFKTGVFLRIHLIIFPIMKKIGTWILSDH